MSTALGLSSIVFYLAATWLLGRRLASATAGGGALRHGVNGVIVVAMCLHGALLYQIVRTDAGLNLGFSNAASLVAWVIVVVLLAAAAAKPTENLGILVLPLAAVTIVLTMTWPGAHVVSDQVGIGVETHIVISIIAASILTIAACQALALAYQERRLRIRRPGRVMGILPPLRTQESLLFQMIAAGFFLLSLSLVSGMVFLEDMLAQHLAHKTVLSIVAWVVFAVLLWGRWRFGWRGRRAIRWSLGGFFSLMLAYFGSKLVLELILGRSW